MKNKLIYALIMLSIAISAMAGAAFYYLYAPMIAQDGGVTYYLKPGTAKKVMIAELTQQGVIQSPYLFSLYVYSHPGEHLKTGEYLFPKGASLQTMWHQMTTGTGLAYHPFAIIPGWSFHQLRSELAKVDGLRHASAHLDDKQIMSHMGRPDLMPEGEFFPETYYYTRGNLDLVILKRAFALMQTKLKQAWDARSPGLPYKNEYEALIAASLIEKEAYLDQERPIIAGVLINRLRKDMLLQIDPTVIYGMGDRYIGQIHRDNLLENTAYNTYVHKGLPPTPIAMPGLLSIEAAVHPQSHDFYYYVAKGDGSHQFSKTLQQHNDAVSAARKNGINQANKPT